MKNDHKTFVNEQQTLAHVLHALSREVCRDLQRVDARQTALRSLQNMAAASQQSSLGTNEKFDAVMNELEALIEPARTKFHETVDFTMLGASTLANSATEYDTRKLVTLDKKQRHHELLNTLYANDAVVAQRIMHIEDTNAAAKSTAKTAAGVTSSATVAASSSQAAVEHMAKALSVLVPAPPKCLLYTVDSERDDEAKGSSEGECALPPAQFLDSLTKLYCEGGFSSKQHTFEERPSGGAAETIGKFISESLDADVVRLNCQVSKELVKMYNL